MVSKRWQKRQPWLVHVALALIWGSALFWLQLNLASWTKLLLIAVTTLLIALVVTVLGRRPVDTMIRVVVAERDAVAAQIQRAFSRNAVPFRKQTWTNRVRFDIPGRGLTLLVEACPLNVPIDDNIMPTMATKVTLHSPTPQTMWQGDELRLIIDRAVA